MTYPDKQPRSKAKASSAKGGGKAAPDRLARTWCREIERYESGTSKWRERAAKIERKYLDEDRDANSTDRRFAILWANIETMKPAIYAREPVPVVTRMWEKDDVGRRASEILERAIVTTFKHGSIHDVMENVRDDRLIAARGTAWVRYEAEVEEDQKTDERICNEFVHWSDFGHSLARNWCEVGAVWRAVYMTREKVKARAFKNGEAVKALKYDVQPDLAEKYPQDADSFEPQAKIHEIWDKTSGKVIWLNKASEIVLEEGDPPLDFREFFPCPRPTYGTKSTRSLIPQPDYRFYQDQAEEIDDLTAKITNLTEWLRLKGFIRAGVSSEGGDAASKLMAIETQLADRGSQILVPVESWAGFQDGGGAKGVIEWLPLDVIVTALREAIACRRELKNDVFELTGLSDIIRGDSDPNETLGAQQLKAQTASRRISTVQRDIARFARDMAELNGEIIAEHFSPETLSEMSGFDLTVEAPPELLLQQSLLKRQLQAPMLGHNGGPPIDGAPMDPAAAAPGAPPAPPQPDPAVVQQLEQIEQQLQQIEFNKQVLALLRDEKTRGFRIDIETDSTIEPDEDAEKQRRVEFLEAVGTFLQQAIPVLQLQPKMAPVFKEMLLFLVRGFRAGRGLEDVVEKAMGEIEQAAAGAGQAPNPEAEKAQAQLQMKQQQHEQQMEAEQARHSETLQAQAQQHQEKLAADAQQHQQTLEAQNQQHQQRLELADRQHEQKHMHELAVERERAGVGSAAEDLQHRQHVNSQAMVEQLVEAASHGFHQLLNVFEELKNEVSAPVEIHRDPQSKRIIGARKGSRVVTIAGGTQ